MKKHTIKKLFLAFSAFIMLFYSVFSVSVFAVHSGGAETGGSDSQSVTDLTGYTWFANDNISLNSVFNYSINFQSNSALYTSLSVQYFAKPFARYELYFGTVGVYSIELGQTSGFWYDFNFKIIEIIGGSDVSNPALISFFESNGTLVFSSTPTPSPSPTPTPQVATPTPDSEASSIPFPTSTTYPQASPLTSDTDFWERMGQNANGAWGVLTTFASGVMSNVVMRNLVIYLPLFGLIVGLIIYTITLGGGDDN